MIPTLLILGPILIGVLLLLCKPHGLRSWIVGITTAWVAIGSVLLVVGPRPAPGNGLLDGHWFAITTMVLEGVMGLFIVWMTVRFKKPLALVLMVAQAALLFWIEARYGSRLHCSSNILIDNFTLIMVAINGLIGGGICLYAISYMRQYHATHKEVANRQPLFFCLLLVFVGAMFGIVLSNNLLWLLFFWEITTLCSFLLIGYTRTPEATNNAFRALVMNLAGGLAFTCAIAWLAVHDQGVDMAHLIAGKQAIILLPAALLCFAGITKAAQLPFSTWLLGAMVAPTPVSALLHSSTMVKAGVYLILRMSPIVAGTRVGLLVALVGALTFLVGSFAAITARDAKRVLAWSTISNLGLIVLCGGIGTYAAVWAGILLIIFHAIAKCLLFLCVGLVEHTLHARDIEKMSGLILHMPKLAIMMLIGMAGMFLAPFGMLISKWAVLKAVVDAYPLLTLFIVFGSATTLFFWVKWMGKILEVLQPRKAVEKEFGALEGVAVYGLSAATFLTCLLFPLISTRFIEPFVLSVYGQTASMSPGNIAIMTIMMLLIMMFPLSFLNYGRRVKVMDAYLGGANLRGSVSFLGSANQENTILLHNYYLTNVISESWLIRWGIAFASMLLVVMVALAIL